MERVAAEKALAEKKAAEERLAAEKTATEKAAELAANQAADKQQAEATKNGKSDDAQNLASLTPPGDTAERALSATELAKLVQVELRRVGCLTAATAGDWNSASQRSLTLFNRYAGTKFDEKSPNRDLLDTIKAKPGRVCPIVCRHGFIASGDRCVEISCEAGSFVNAKNVCEKRREKPSRRQEEPRIRPAADEKTSVAQTPVQQPGSTKPQQCNVYGQCLDICHSRGGGNNGCSLFCSRHTRC
jgi:hypothetical protein